jgi:DNA-binding response OmpR family regulator
LTRGKIGPIPRARAKDKNVPVNAIYIEDEPDIAKLVQNGLGTLGIEVTVFPHPEDLLAARDNAQVTEAELLIIDIRMPGMTGLELAQQLRAAGDRRPILLVSAYNPPSRSQLRELNATFHPKPFDFPVLLQICQRLIAEGSWPSEIV